MRVCCWWLFQQCIVGYSGSSQKMATKHCTRYIIGVSIIQYTYPCRSVVDGMLFMDNNLCGSAYSCCFSSASLIARVIVGRWLQNIVNDI